jgi:hypothetical protein
MPDTLKTFLADDTGGATVEFILVFPALMYFVLMVFETGFIATRSSMLERGLDMATRDLRLGTDPTIDHEKLKQSVCRNAGILKDCNRDLVLEVVTFDIASAYPQNDANCRDRSEKIKPKIDFNPGARNSIMFVRACMIIDPLFPGMGITLGLPKDASGGLQLITYTAFMNEPA